MYSLTEEQQRMAILLQKEYERDGIHCSKPTREKIMSIRENIMRSSMEFQRIAQTARRYVQIPGKYVRLLPHSIQALCEKSMRSADTYHVPTDVHVVNTVLKCVSDPNVRREMYISGNHCAIDNEAVDLTLFQAIDIDSACRYWKNCRNNGICLRVCFNLSRMPISRWSTFVQYNFLLICDCVCLAIACSDRQRKRRSLSKISQNS